VGSAIGRLGPEPEPAAGIGSEGRDGSAGKSGVVALALTLTLAFAEMGVLTFTETGAGIEKTGVAMEAGVAMEMGVAIETVLEISTAKTL
jgi:hypothetical protein